MSFECRIEEQVKTNFHPLSNTDKGFIGTVSNMETYFNAAIRKVGFYVTSFWEIFFTRSLFYMGLL